MFSLSITPNRDLMSHARASLRGNWGVAIGVLVTNILIAVAISLIPFVGGIANIVIGGAFALGLATFFLSVTRTQKAKFGMLFDGFSHFVTALCAYLLMVIFIVLWMLLLIIPGIIAAFSYAMTFYIIHDNPATGALAAIKRSKQIMNGNKWKYLCLSFRFFGWGVLATLTLGIGFLWLIPYMATSNAAFYDDILASEKSSQATALGSGKEGGRSVVVRVVAVLLALVIIAAAVFYVAIPAYQDYLLKKEMAAVVTQVTKPHHKEAVAIAGKDAPSAVASAPAMLPVQAASQPGEPAPSALPATRTLPVVPIEMPISHIPTLSVAAKKRVTTAWNNPPSSDLRHCLSLESNVAIAKCADPSR